MLVKSMVYCNVPLTSLEKLVISTANILMASFLKKSRSGLSCHISPHFGLFYVLGGWCSLSLVDRLLRMGRCSCNCFIGRLKCLDEMFLAVKIITYFLVLLSVDDIVTFDWQH